MWRIWSFGSLSWVPLPDAAVHRANPRRPSQKTRSLTQVAAGTPISRPTTIGATSPARTRRPDMPEALQEYGPNGQPIGTPIVVCPSQAIPKPNVPPPPPPTPAEVWAHVSLPSPALAINPATVGITQLPSWFWVTGVGGAVTVTATINGYSVTTTATPVAYQWNFGDGSTDTSQTPGSEFDPSVTHTYDYKGTYIVSLLVDYTGTFSYAGAGGTGTESLGNYVEPGTSAPYVVQEVRSVLMPTQEG